MRANVILKLLKNEMNQYNRNRSNLLSGVAGDAFVLLLLLLLIVFPYQGMDDLHAALINSIRTRYPGIDDVTLVRIAVSETIIPGLLMLIASFAPGFLALSTLTAEKEQKTLECLLLLPISDKEILVSKILSSTPFAVLGTWAVYWISAIFAACYHHHNAYALYLLNANLLVGVFLLVPSLAVLSALGGIMVSINTADTKTAQNLWFIPAGVLMSVCYFLMLGTFTYSQGFLLIATIMVNCLNVVGLGIAVACFKRERILLRY